VVAFLAAAWKNNWGGIQEKVAEAVKFIKIRFTILKIIFMRWFDIVRTLFEAFQAAFSGDWRLFGEKLREAWDKAWQLIKDIVNTAWDVLRGKIVEIVVNIVKFFTDTDWKQVGIDIVTGIGNGLASMMTWLADAARNVAQAALDAAKGFLGISSPSKAFGELGKFSAIGFGEAFTDTMAGFNPEMNMAMAGGFGGVSVPGAGSVGGGGGSNDSLMHDIQRMLKSLPDDLKRANKDLISKLGKR